MAHLNGSDNVGMNIVFIIMPYFSLLSLLHFVTLTVAAVRLMKQATSFSPDTAIHCSVLIGLCHIRLSRLRKNMVHINDEGIYGRSG